MAGGGLMGLPYFRLYAKDFMADSRVRALDDASRGFLVQLWCLCCMDGGFPGDPEKLAKVLSRRSDHVLKAWLKVASFFVEDPLNPGFMVSSRLLRDSQTYEAKVHANQINGKLGGRPKTNPLGYEEENPKQTPPEPEPEPIKNVQDSQANPKPARVKKVKPESKSLTGILGGKGSQAWERFWKFVAIWGRDKVPAPKTLAIALLAAFEKEEPKNIYIAGLHYRDEFLPPRRARDETQFMKSPLAWLEEEAWHVELQAIEKEEKRND